MKKNIFLLLMIVVFIVIYFVLAAPVIYKYNSRAQKPHNVFSEEDNRKENYAFFIPLALHTLFSVIVILKITRSESSRGAKITICIASYLIFLIGPLIGIIYLLKIREREQVKNKDIENGRT